MTLYYYVRNKADIVALMQDAIFADVLVPAGEFPSGWRDAVALIARRTRNALVGHPWAVSSLNQAHFGPNAMRHYEQSLAALATTALSYPQKTEVTAILDDYVAGNASHAIEAQERLRAASLTALLDGIEHHYGISYPPSVTERPLPRCAGRQRRSARPRHQKPRTRPEFDVLDVLRHRAGGAKGLNPDPVCCCPSCDLPDAGSSD
jgi:hypothetical protein